MHLSPVSHSESRDHRDAGRGGALVAALVRRLPARRGAAPARRVQAFRAPSRQTRLRLHNYREFLKHRSLLDLLTRA